MPRLALLLLAATACRDPGKAGPPEAIDPLGFAVDQLGPYAVGYEQFMPLDAACPTPPRPGRPVTISVLYPVDPTQLGNAPKPVYALNPANNARVISAPILERYGFDAAYLRPPVSAARPFPLVVLSPGWGSPFSSRSS